MGVFAQASARCIVQHADGKSAEKKRNQCVCRLQNILHNATKNTILETARQKRYRDEVEEMSAKMQVSLLRVLEKGRLTRVGAERPRALDVRVIAASNEDLKEAVKQKRFRLDLYHRLSPF